MNTLHNKLGVVVENYTKIGMSPTKFKVEDLKAVDTEKINLKSTRNIERV